MPRGYPSGDPDQVWRGIPVRDVVNAMAHLEDGFRTYADFEAAYCGMGLSNDLAHLIAARTVVGLLTKTQHKENGEKGWIINRRILAQRWRRLPWPEEWYSVPDPWLVSPVPDDPDFRVEADEMSPETVG